MIRLHKNNKDKTYTDIKCLFRAVTLLPLLKEIHVLEYISMKLDPHICWVDTGSWLSDTLSLIVCNS